MKLPRRSLPDEHDFRRSTSEGGRYPRSCNREDPKHRKPPGPTGKQREGRIKVIFWRSGNLSSIIADFNPKHVAELLGVNSCPVCQRHFSYKGNLLNHLEKYEPAIIASVFIDSGQLCYQVPLQKFFKEVWQNNENKNNF